MFLSGFSCFRNRSCHSPKGSLIYYLHKNSKGHQVIYQVESENPHLDPFSMATLAHLSQEPQKKDRTSFENTKIVLSTRAVLKVKSDLRERKKSSHFEVTCHKKKITKLLVLKLQLLPNKNSRKEGTVKALKA